MVPATKDHVLPKLTVHSLEGILKSLLPAAKGHLYYFLRQFEILTVMSVSMNIKPLAAFIHLPPPRCVSLPDLQAIVPSPHSLLQ